MRYANTINPVLFLVTLRFIMVAPKGDELIDSAAANFVEQYDRFFGLTAR
jgi:hypothetical protein